MFDITKLALKIPNFLSINECNQLIQEFNDKETESIQENNVDRNTKERVFNNYQALTINPNSINFNLVKQKTKEVIDIYLNYLNSTNFFSIDLGGMLRYSHKYRILKYKEGSSINAHSDHTDYTYGSISFNLNDNYEGGEFKFFNGNYTVSLSKGDALIFPADFFWVHEVTKVTKGERYSINSFIRSNPEEIFNQSNYLTNLLTNDYLQNIPSEKLLGPYN